MIPAQIPLTDDGSCEGGQLLFACSDGRLMHVQRRVGSIMSHDGDAVHGVTRLVKGIRYGLYALRGRLSATLPPPPHIAEASKVSQSDKLQVRRCAVF